MLLLPASLISCGGKPAPPPNPPAAPVVAAPPKLAPPPTVDVPPAARVRPPHTIFRDELELALSAGPGWLLRQLQPTPHRVHGRFVGWTINAVFPDAPDVCPPGCDLVVGDIILRINGESLETPDAFSRAFERAGGWASIQLVRLRDGASERVVYHVVDSPPPPP